MSNLQVIPEASSIFGSRPTSHGAAPQPRLVRAAHEFEAAMMKELLEPMTPGHSQLGDTDDVDNSSSALSSFASEALGKAISEHGGFGIANSIIHQLSTRSSHSGNSPVPGNRGPNPTISPFK
jgi:Rod binding domain-containing protein